MYERLNIENIKNKIEKMKLDNISLNIDSLFLEKNNQLDKIFYKDEYLHELRSCTKVLVSMAIGISIDRKMKINDQSISLNTKIYPIIKSKVCVKNEKNLLKVKKWTIRDLLTHSAGYESQMMSKEYIKDLDKGELLDYALNYDIPYEPGERFAYTNVEPFVLSVFFQEAFNINLRDFINENIFKKMDILEYKWENYGKYCPGGTGLFMKHTDFHKIGQLLLNNGKYGEIQIISEDWVNEMCKMQLETPTEYKPERVFPKIGAGYFTFVSRDDFVFRDGHNGQYIILNKKYNVLISIMSSEEDMKNITEVLRDFI